MSDKISCWMGQRKGKLAATALGQFMAVIALTLAPLINAMGHAPTEGKKTTEYKSRIRPVVCQNNLVLNINLPLHILSICGIIATDCVCLVGIFGGAAAAATGGGAAGGAGAGAGSCGGVAVATSRWHQRRHRAQAQIGRVSTTIEIWRWCCGGYGWHILVATPTTRDPNELHILRVVLTLTSMRWQRRWRRSKRICIDVVRVVVPFGGSCGGCALMLMMWMMRLMEATCQHLVVGIVRMVQATQTRCFRATRCCHCHARQQLHLRLDTVLQMLQLTCANMMTMLSMYPMAMQTCMIAVAAVVVVATCCCCCQQQHCTAQQQQRAKHWTVLHHHPLELCLCRN